MQTVARTDGRPVTRSTRRRLLGLVGPVLVAVGGAVVLAAHPAAGGSAGPAAHSTRAAAAAARASTYADYSLITRRSAGRFYSGGKLAGRWDWRPEAKNHWSIGWRKGYREHFVRSADGRWVLLDGWTDNGTYYTQRVTRESYARYSRGRCVGWTRFRSDHHRQHYVRWQTQRGAYCLAAAGRITERSTGKVVHFDHRQLWLPPAGCSNRYHHGQVCIRQVEKWSDDNHHRMKVTLRRTQYLARGLGMAYKIRQTYPNRSGADLKEHRIY